MPDDPMLLECPGCGADFLAPLTLPVDAVLCARCATRQPCGHLWADTVDDLAGQPVCARCLEERPYA